ncbi:MAG: DNA repair protein RadA [Acidobacteria bacterium]|nr:DNA repair protein RadA [Acidobacteriota bacterium]
MVKEKTIYSCQQCGFQSKKWLGKCPDCNAWNSLVEEKQTKSSDIRVSSGSSIAANYQDISSQDNSRVSSGVAEFDRVLGGGIVPGSLVLIGGDPGIGKSTLLLQVAEKLSQNHKVLYVSGEESEKQIKLRGQRLGLEPNNLFLVPETCLEKITDEIEHHKPTCIIVDSVQTVYSEKIESAPGGISQIREVAGQMLVQAKRNTISIFLIGHVTKEGMLAGPKALEHIVDTVLYFEGEHHHNHRIVRAVKNRFGPANELGIFEMTSNGLIPVKNASELFLKQRPLGVAGSVVLACMEGTRPILVEIQALVTSSNYGNGRRMAQGVDPNRVALLIAMLEKRAGFHLYGADVFINVAGGITLDEPAADLGIVAAIISSFKNIPIEPSITVFGEVGLAGEVRSTSQPNVRLREVAAMGLGKCLMPANNVAALENPGDVEVVGIRSVIDLLDELF